jgi:hypothetical protein
MHLLDLFSVSCFVHVDVFSLPHVCCFLMYAFFSSKFGRSFLYFTFCTSNLVSLPCVCCFLMYAFFFFSKVASGHLLDLFCVSRFVLADVFSLPHVCWFLMYVLYLLYFRDCLVSLE